MKIEASNRISSIGSYAFADVDNEVAKLKKLGISPIDFGVGDPKSPTPELVRAACKKALDERKSSGYPSYIGTQEYRETIANWTKKRFGVKLNPDTEVSSSIGAKESVFNFHEGFVNPGDIVLMPNPGYPPYERGTLFAEGKPYFLNLTEENNFLPDLGSIPNDIVKKSKVLWINYPNNPTSALATKGFLKEVIDFGHDNDIVIASDECYTEIYFDEKPLSILELTKEGVVAVQSLSKRSSMTCYRVGWLAGDENIINVFKKVKTNIDSGTATFIQDAAAAALKDESHVESARAEYKKKRDIMIEALMAAGLKDCTPRATLYIWQKAPDGTSCVDFAKKLLDKDVAVVTTPGAWISTKANGVNPGECYVRFALVPTLEDCRKAAERIKNLKF
ncbi:aminotransferase class I/II-fold pyridoxal phosphate-dependent enzyme [Candidatus Woesearchaeota archaeon]|nr:aminotransferase class I/II-fold pyridoxal phosphate-dependent enzyme [Candidatus Woesearchaeota archaeon]